MSDFVWIIPSEMFSSLGNRGVSPNYLIPQGHMRNQEARLAGNRVWVVLRGADDRCVVMAIIKKVEKFNPTFRTKNCAKFCFVAGSETF
jgi:hypothetical protein